jgi:hypothetical protein
MTLPPEALLLRRMEGLLFQTAAITRASAPWGKLLRELIEGAEPVGDLGAQHAAWLARRPKLTARASPDKGSHASAGSGEYLPRARSRCRPGHHPRRACRHKRARCASETDRSNRRSAR